MSLAKILYKTLQLPETMNVEISTPDNYKATLIFIHGIGMSKRMWRQIDRHFQANCQIVKVDLLGHGQSSDAKWLKYNLRDQARSLFLTLFKNNQLFDDKPVIIVGHSLGSLVAVEFADRYPEHLDQLVLISPPIYLQADNLKEDLLCKSYQTLLSNDKFLSLTLKLGQIFFGLKSSSDVKSQQAFAKSLQKAILEQDVFNKLRQIKLPVSIIYGIFDPVIVADNFTDLPNLNAKISLESTWAFHNLHGLLAQKTIRRLKRVIKQFN